MASINYHQKLTLKPNEVFDINYINYINYICSHNPNKNILVEVANTKSLNSAILKNMSPNISFRIAGAYDKERLDIYQNQIFGNENAKEYYYDSVIYTKNETIKIIEEMEKIERGINKNWSDIQKVVYIYEKLKTNIMYDPKFETKSSKDIRSLRGLITKQSVCAGYSLIFKEMMDRQNIKCDFVRGNSHAWNIITINNKMYPIDLTWDNAKYRSGNFNSLDFLGQDIDTFNKQHLPDPREPLYGYQSKLSQIDPNLIKQFRLQIGRSNDYKTSTYQIQRKDGSKFILAQIGNAKINNQNYYRYYYVGISPDGTNELPIILYSDTNVAHFVNAKKYDKQIPEGYEEALTNILFSKENIKDSLNRKTYYIGNIRKNNQNNKLELVQNTQEITKPDEKNNLFTNPTKRYTRSDGTTFIVQQMSKHPVQIKGADVTRYDILEIVNENGKNILKRNTIFTERDFFKDNRQSMIDNYLSRERLDKKSIEAGGYIGYYDANGFEQNNPDLIEYFELSKTIDIDFLNNKNQSNKKTSQIPSFNEMKNLALNYKIVIDTNNSTNIDTSSIKISNINTGKIESDPEIIKKATFANIWLTAAGVKLRKDEQRTGIDYAFNEPAENLYNIVCNELTADVTTNGVIDTVKLFQNVDSEAPYKHSQEIIVELFKTPYQTELINSMFLNSVGINQQNKTPEPLYSISYAGNLAYNNQNKHGRR